MGPLFRTPLSNAQLNTPWPKVQNLKATLRGAVSQAKDAEDMAVVLEDLIKLLDGYSNSLRRGRYPDDKHTEKLVAVLRAVADQIDA